MGYDFKKKTDIFRYPSDRALTEMELYKFISKNDQMCLSRYKPLQDAYDNRYEIFRMPKKPAWKPDSRISMNFAAEITDTFEGFLMGQPISFSSDDEAVQEYLTHLHSYAGQTDHTAELSTLVSIFGRAYEIYYVDADGEIDMSYLSPMDAFMVFDEGIDPEPLYFVRTYYDYDGMRRGSISDVDFVRYFHIQGGIQWDGEPLPHGFDGVPATEYKQSVSRKGVFEDALSAVDAYNLVVSEKCNDVRALADAYLKIIGAPDIDKESMMWMRDNHIIYSQGTFDGKMPEIDFLGRPSADGTQENLLNRLEKNIFSTSNVVNLNSEGFQQASGKALRQRMQAMINLAGRKQRKLDEGFKRRYRLIFSNPCSGMADDAWTAVSWKYNLMLPDVLGDEADTAGKLAGVVSKRTQLKVLSIVDDPDKEIEAMEKEQAAVWTDGYDIDRTDKTDKTDKDGDA